MNLRSCCESIVVRSLLVKVLDDKDPDAGKPAEAAYPDIANRSSRGGKRSSMTTAI